MTLTIYLLATVAGGLAISAAWRRFEHRPVAWLVCGALIIDLVQRTLLQGVLTPVYTASGGAPFTGWVRAAFHLDQALFLAWPFGIAAVAWLVFLRRTPRPVALAYAATLAVLILGYPTIRGALLGKIYAGLHAAALVASVYALIDWSRRYAPPRVEHLSALVIVVLDFALFAGPYCPIEPNPFTRWHFAQYGFGVMYLMLIAIQGRFLWGRPTPSPSPDLPSSLH